MADPAAQDPAAQDLAVQDRAAKDAVARVWAARANARGALDLAYLLYLVVITILVIAVPLLRELGLLLARPDVLPVISAPAAGGLVTAGLLLAAGLLVLLGASRGPAVLPPFFVVTLASSHRPRRTALVRPFARTGAALAAGLLALAGVIGWVLVLGGTTSPAGAVALGIAGLGAAALLEGAWLAGQVLPGVGRRILALVLALGAAGAVLGTVRGGAAGRRLLALAYPVGGADAGVPWTAALAVLVLGVLVGILCVPALDRVRGTVLLEQAARWESALTSARSGDLSAAAGTYRVRPSVGRRLPAVRRGARSAGLVGLYLRRDLVALARTPERLVLGVLGVLAASVLLVAARLLMGPLGFAALVLGALLLWSASGVFVDGLRHGVESLGAPRLLAQGVGVQVLLHSLAPLLVMGLLSVLGSGLGVLVLPGAGPGLGPDPGAVGALAVVLAPALVPLMIIGRARDAAKGPMPLALATPIPTPQGDASILPLVAWQADAILFALLAAGLLFLALGASWTWGIGLWAVAGVLLASDARRRVQELSRGGR
ncbi:hypothetical protein Bra3105_05645 [Brachybacterium halotolerans subsp. kimchii]|uniref:hypothetical protein n=1 Tax=Brachybacterium halotolerans TaxID=2795215 RepID=UPI001E434F0E|nr:hypothetical protein [Brachybacterium halotolerans]UEJ83798.1 hypothetical protein Bra3105_05645 [Brachybacterium halotolerans subsp. kimchii]